MQDRPDKRALLGAIARFLQEEARPALADPRLAFRALIAANLATIVAAEVASEGADAEAELAGARALLGLTQASPMPPREEQRAALAAANARLAALLRDGAPSRDDVRRIRAHLITSLQARLAVDNPRFDTSLVIE